MILGKYNQAKTITFDLFDIDGVDLSIAATFAAGDVKIMKDEGAEANTTNLPTDEGSSYSLVLTATEMSAARLRIILIDQTATKVWLDISIGVETYGNASAEHAFDLDTANVTLAATTHTGAVIPTVTTLTNLPAITANWLTAAGINAGALDGKGDWNIGKTGYSLTQTFPTNFADMSITVTTGRIDVGSVGGTTQTANDNGADINTLITQIGTAGAGLTDLGAMSTAMKAEVLAEVNAALDTAISELGVAAPTATPTLRTGLMLLYMALRNKTVVQTSGIDAIEFYNNAGTKITSKALTDDGSDMTEAEMV